MGAYPDKEIYVVLDNLNVHKPEYDCWLQRHKNVHFFYTPTHASWLNQEEIWFGIVWKPALRGASFTSLDQVIEAIDDFVAAHNEKASPFEWKAVMVYPSSSKDKHINLRK